VRRLKAAVEQERLKSKGLAKEKEVWESEKQALKKEAEQRKREEAKGGHLGLAGRNFSGISDESNGNCFKEAFNSLLKNVIARDERRETQYYKKEMETNARTSLERIQQQKKDMQMNAQLCTERIKSLQILASGGTSTRSVPFPVDFTDVKTTAQEATDAILRGALDAYFSKNFGTNIRRKEISSTADEMLKQIVEYLGKPNRKFLLLSALVSSLTARFDEIEVAEESPVTLPLDKLLHNAVYLAIDSAIQGKGLTFKESSASPPPPPTSPTPLSASLMGSSGNATGQQAIK